MNKKHFLPLLTIALAFVVVFITNVSFGKFLVGWDNLLPELDFGLNIKRSIFSVWEEYQSFGLLAGNGHGANIIHQIFLYITSLIIPTNFLRQIYVFLTLLVGTLGAYALCYFVLNYHSKKIPTLESRNILASISASLFYLLNLATVQNYFVPFEPFVTHFAFLPWLLFSALYYIYNRSKKALLLLIGINILSLGQGQVPTVFIVYFCALAMILLFTGFRTKQLKANVKVLLLTLIINAFWLLPFLYFAITNSSIALTAKINQMSTETVIAQNKEFGNLLDVILLRGFWFNNLDPDMSGRFRFMLEPFREHLQNPLAVVTGISLFSVILLGVIVSFLKRSRLSGAFFLLFLSVFSLLALNVFPFSFFDSVLRKLPLINEVLRFPFTKFSILAALIYSVFFAFGIRFLIAWVSLYSKKAIYAVPTIFIALLIFFVWPIFKGNLIYENEKIVIPNEYHQTFDFFKNQDKNTRIATLPLQSFWGWNYYEWGYGGSGFLWYGIKQPIVDRAFDVWSKNSEGSYYELSNALYSNNALAFEKTLNKFDITWLILDKNVYSPSSPKSLRFEETEELLKKVPSIKKAAEYGNIVIYKTSINDATKNYLDSKPILPSVNSYNYSTADLHYENFGDYKSNSQNSYFYPFRTLFSNKKQVDKEFVVFKSGKSYIFEREIQNIKEDDELTIPSLLKENIIPVEIVSEKGADETVIISAKILTPKVIINNNVVYGNTPIYFPLFVIPNGIIEDLSISLNGNIISNITSPSSTFISTQNSNYFVLENKAKTILASQSIEPDYLATLPELSEKKIKVEKENIKISIQVPEVFDNTNSIAFKPSQLNTTEKCNLFKQGSSKNILKDGYKELSSINSTLCTSVYAGELAHSQGYLIAANVKNIKGRGIHFWVLNENQGQAPIDTYFEKEDTSINIILPPQESYAKGYSLHFDNISIGNDEVKNQLGDFSISVIPYKFLTNIVAKNDNSNLPNKFTFTSTHPNESLYRISDIVSQNANQATLTLSQSYDKGWAAYVVNRDSKFASFLPFVFGKKLNEHVKINNWANGWEVSPSEVEGKDVVIVFLPQYLQYFGFLLLGILLSILLLRPLHPAFASIYKTINNYFETKSLHMKHKVSTLLTT